MHHLMFALLRLYFFFVQKQKTGINVLANITTNIHPEACPCIIFTKYFRVNNGILASTFTTFV